MTWRTLSEEERYVIEQGGTEAPFTGKLLDNKEEGLYLCARCGTPLFESTSKFDSGSGWPSFDDAIPGRVKQSPDPDGIRTEIICAACGGHLGHVFQGERFTPKDTRHCVNSVAMEFVPSDHLETAYFAGGCFWGIECHMDRQPGVIEAVSGYMGGSLQKPGYEDVKTGRTGHVETVRVLFDRTRVSYEDLAKLFFEIHDPTQTDGQGPDLGSQYLSVVFYANLRQKAVLERLLGELRAGGYKVATRLQEAPAFWPAEAYHQDYLERAGKTPSCHQRVKRF